MTHDSASQNTPSSIYPGEYQPPPGREGDFADELRSLQTGYMRGTVNINKMPDHYEIEISAPGFTKGDFMVHTDDCILSVTAVREKQQNKETRSYSPAYPQYEYLKQSVILPDDLDSDFLTAEYKNGILSLYFYRNDCPIKNRKHQVIIY